MLQRPATRRGPLVLQPQRPPASTTSSLYDGDLSASTLSVSACSSSDSSGAATDAPTSRRSSTAREASDTAGIEVAFSSAAVEASAAYSQDFEDPGDEEGGAPAPAAAGDVWHELEQLHNTLQCAPRRSSSSSGSSSHDSSSSRNHSAVSRSSSSPHTDDAVPLPPWQQHPVQPQPAAGRDDGGSVSVSASGDAEHVLRSLPVVQQGRGGTATRLLAEQLHGSRNSSGARIDAAAWRLSSAHLQLQQQQAPTLSAPHTAERQPQPAGHPGPVACVAAQGVRPDSAACRDASRSSRQHSMPAAARRSMRSVALQFDGMSDKAVQASQDDGAVQQPEGAAAAASPRAQQPAGTQDVADGKQPCCGCSRSRPATPGWAAETQPLARLPAVGLGAWGALSASVQQLRAASLLDQLERLIQVAERQQQQQQQQQQASTPLEVLQQPGACRGSDIQQQPAEQKEQLTLSAEADTWQQQGSSWWTVPVNDPASPTGGKPAPAAAEAPAPGAHSAASATPHQQQHGREAEAPAHVAAAPPVAAASPRPDAAAGWFSITLPAELQEQQEEEAVPRLSSVDTLKRYASCVSSGSQNGASVPGAGLTRSEASALQHRVSAAASAAAQHQQQHWQDSGLLQKLRQVRGVLRAAAAAAPPQGFQTCSSGDLVSQSLLLQHFNASVSRVRARIGGLSDEVGGLQRSLISTSASADRASDAAARNSAPDCCNYTSLEETLAKIRRHRSAAARAQQR